METISIGRCNTCRFGKKISKLKGSKYVCKKPKPNPLWEYTFSGDFGCVNYEEKRSNRHGIYRKGL